MNSDDEPTKKEIENWRAEQVKPIKKPMSEAKKAQFAKAQEALKASRALKKELKEKPPVTKPEVNKESETVTKTPPVQANIEPEDSSSEEEVIIKPTKKTKTQVIYVPEKRKKKKVVVMDSSSDSSSDDSYHYQRKSKKKHRKSYDNRYFDEEKEEYFNYLHNKHKQEMIDASEQEEPIVRKKQAKFSFL